ncbi:MAG: SCO6745 family protein [Acidimicrobiales bacterium]
MTYDDIVSIFMATPATPIPEPTLPTSPARRLRDALEPIATQGWWSRPASDRVAALGLGFFDGYVWGRAASLGAPSAAVVVATFGVFDPATLTAVYEQAVTVAGCDDVLAARAEGAAEALAAVIADDEAAALADPLLAALAGVDGLGRPLFSALRALPVPETAHGRLWRAAELVREHRGDGHLAAVVAAGIDMAAVNVLTELWLGFGVGEYSATRGLGGDRLAATVASLEGQGLVTDGALTSAGRALRDELEAATDRSQRSLISALGDDLEPIVLATDAVSASIVAAQAFPSDPRKRAAG